MKMKEAKARIKRLAQSVHKEGEDGSQLRCFKKYLGDVMKQKQMLTCHRANMRT